MKDDKEIMTALLNGKYLSTSNGKYVIGMEDNGYILLYDVEDNKLYSSCRVTFYIEPTIWEIDSRFSTVEELEGEDEYDISYK